MKNIHPQLKWIGGLAIPYNKDLKEKSRVLRNNSTKPEIILWKQLRAKGLGYTFNRQKPLLNYIVDFYCPKLKLVIEVDGTSHDSAEAQAYDRRREEELGVFGIEFLRFDNEVVLEDIEGVVWAIVCKIEALEEWYGL